MEHLRILVVEDEPADFVLIERTLRQLETFSVDVELASDLAAARRAAEARPFDAALIDFFVKRECGLDLVPELVAKDGRCAPILLTGQLDQSVHGQALRAGVLASLPKENLSPRLLEVALRHALQNRTLLTKLLNCLSELTHAHDEKLELAANFTRLMGNSLEAVVNCAFGIEDSLAARVDRAKLAPQVRSLGILASDLRHYCRETSVRLGAPRSESETESAVDLQLALADVLRAVSDCRRERGAHIDVEFGEYPLFVLGDEPALLLGLTDLIQASILHLAPGGRLDIMAAANDDRIVLGICSRDFASRPDNVRQGGALRVARGRALIERNGGSVEIGTPPTQDGYVVLIALKAATRKHLPRYRFSA